jgi:hypothetical protein
VAKDMITIQTKLIFKSKEDKQTVADLMRRWSSCMRFAYNRLLGTIYVFCKRKFPIFAKIFPQAPVGNFYVNLTAS